MAGLESKVTLQDALVTTGLDGGILYWSRGARKLFGHRERTIRGVEFQELMPANHRRLDDLNVREVQVGQVVRNVLVKVQDEAGATHRCLQTMLPVYDENGAVVAVQRLFFDMTKIHSVECLLRAVRSELKEIQPCANGDEKSDPLFWAERRQMLEEYLRLMQQDLVECQSRCHELQGLARIQELGTDRAEREYVLADG